MSRNNKILKKHHRSKQIESEIISLQRQLLGTQYLLGKLKINQESQSIDQQKNKKIPLRQEFQKILNQKVPSDQLSKRNLSQLLLRQDPSIRKKQFEIRELISINDQLQKTEQKMKLKRQEYNEIMKRHYKYVHPNKPEQMFNKYVREKLIKNIENLQNDISQIYQMGGRSSISSSSVGNYAIQDWINQQKEQKLIKEQQSLIQEINILQKQLSQI